MQQYDKKQQIRYRNKQRKIYNCHNPCRNCKRIDEEADATEEKIRLGTETEFVEMLESQTWILRKAENNYEEGYIERQSDKRVGDTRPENDHIEHYYSQGS